MNRYQHKNKSEVKLNSTHFKSCVKVSCPVFSAAEKTFKLFQPRYHSFQDVCYRCVATWLQPNAARERFAVISLWP